MTIEHDAQRTVTGENQPQQVTLTVEPQQTITGENDLQQVTAARSSIQQVTTRNDDTLNYDELLDDDKELDKAIDKLSCWNNFCRSIIPYLLLILLTTILSLAYLSCDLHPLACIGCAKKIKRNYKKNNAYWNNFVIRGTSLKDHIGRVGKRISQDDILNDDS